MDDSRWIRKNGALAVYVPPKGKQRPEDHERDFPPNAPPEVVYMDIHANYWRALREGNMPYLGGVKTFSVEQMSWLRSVEADVEKLMHS